MYKEIVSIKNSDFSAESSIKNQSFIKEKIYESSKHSVVQKDIKKENFYEDSKKKNSKTVFLKIKKNTNKETNHHIQNLHDMFHSTEDLSILKSFDKELINNPKNKLNIKSDAECDKEKETLSAEEQKKKFILERIKEQNMKNIASLVNSKNYFIGIKTDKETEDSSSSVDGYNKKTKYLINKLKENNMVVVDDKTKEKSTEYEDSSEKSSKSITKEFSKFNKYFNKGAIVQKNSQKAKCKKGKGEEDNDSNENENSSSQKVKGKSNLLKIYFLKLLFHFI